MICGTKQRENSSLAQYLSATLQILLIAILQFLFVPPSSAHGDLHHQIEALDRKIKIDGPSTSILLQRADLHRLHKNWNAALEDLSTAEKLGAHEISLHKARVYVDAKKALKAKEILNIYLAENPQSIEGYYLRSQTWLLQKDYLKSVEDLDKTLSLSKSRSPDLYFERASLLKNIGGEQNLKRALIGLNEGVTVMGPLVSLQDLAIQIDLDLNDYADALTRIEQLLSTSQRKERWLALKSDILSRAGNKQEAQIVKEQALQAIASLPPEHRNTKAILKLEENLKSRKLTR